MKHSIIVPAHNEAEKLEANVEAFLAELARRTPDLDFEIVLVENGSRDATLDACGRLAERHPGRIRAASTGKPGYGSAVRRGIAECAGESLTVLECDFLDVGFLEASLRAMRGRGSRFVVGSKRARGSVDRRPWQRRMLTRGLNALMRLALGYPGTDTRGLKTIDTKLARELSALIQTGEEAQQTELVLLAWRLGHRIEEVPIAVAESRPVRISVLRRMPGGLAMIWALRRSLGRFPPRATPAGTDEKS